MSAPLVEVEGLERRFEVDPVRKLLGSRRAPSQVLRGVDFELAAGEWLAVMGSNGAGKTTLLKVIAGLLLPSAGTVRVHGHDVAHDLRAVREIVGYALADERSFNWRLTARQNLWFYAGLEQLGRSEGRERVAGLLERLDLARDADRPFFELSTGMRQRLAIARALLKRPQVLLMDEPTRSIDATHAAEMWPLVRGELEESEGCAILVTHFAQDAVAQCTRVASLEDGRLREWAASEAPPAGSGRRQLTVTVRNLRPEVVDVLRGLPGVTSLSIRQRDGDELVLEVAAEDGQLSLASFVDVVSRSGASVRSLEQTSGIEAVADPHHIGRGEVAPASVGTARQ